MVTNYIKIINRIIKKRNKNKDIVFTGRYLHIGVKYRQAQMSKRTDVELLM